MPQRNKLGSSKETGQIMASQKTISKRDAMLAAAKSLYAKGGVASIKPNLIAEVAGSSRTNFYDYFTGTDQYSAEIVLSELAELRSHLESKLQSLQGTEDVVKTWSETLLDYYSDGSHQIMTGLLPLAMNSEFAAEIRIGHEAIYDLLVKRVTVQQGPEIEFAKRVIRSIIERAAEQIKFGAPAERIKTSTIAFLSHGLNGLLGDSQA